MRTCVTCETEKPLDEFPYRKERKTYRTQCKDCKREYQASHRAANQQMYRDKAKRRRDNLKAIIVGAKNVPCVDCGVKYHHCIMDFDHLPGHLKKFNISQGRAKSYSIDEIEDEIAKCEVVCSNCHRMRTWARQEGLRN